MKSNQCMNCGKTFKPAPQVTKQTYCNSTACQKERRKKWQMAKIKTDPDYKENQARAQKAWVERNPDYWRQHRKDKQDYENSLATKQGVSDANSGNTAIKMDSSNQPLDLHKALQDGVFRLKVLAEPDGIKMDSWIVELSCIHEGSEPTSRHIKR